MSTNADGVSFTIGEWLVEPDLNRIVRGDDVVKIDPRNMRVLQLLASRPCQVISQTEIEQIVWADVVVTPNSVYQSIAQLRRALGDDKAQPRYIETIARKGYRLVAQLDFLDIDNRRNHSSILARFFDRAYRLKATAALLLIASALGLSGSMYRASHSFPVLEQDATYSGNVEVTRAILLPVSIAPESPHLRVHTLTQMSLAALNDGRPEEARIYAQQALEHEIVLTGAKDPNAGESLTLLAYAQLWLALYEDAEATARRAIASFGADSGVQPARIDALRCLGSILADRGNFSEAGLYLTQAIELADQLYGTRSGFAAETRADLASLRRMEGRLSESEAILRELLQNEGLLRRNKVLEVMFRTQLGDTLLAQNRYEDAKLEMEGTLSIASQTLRANHPYVATARELLGKAYIGLMEYEEAEPLLRSAMMIWRDNGTWTWRVGRSASALGEALLGQGLIDDADKYLAFASRTLETAPGGQLKRLALIDHKTRIQKLSALVNERYSQSAKYLQIASDR